MVHVSGFVSDTFKAMFDDDGKVNHYCKANDVCSLLLCWSKGKLIHGSIYHFQTRDVTSLFDRTIFKTFPLIPPEDRTLFTLAYGIHIEDLYMNETCRLTPESNAKITKSAVDTYKQLGCDDHKYYNIYGVNVIEQWLRGN